MELKLGQKHGGRRGYSWERRGQGGGAPVLVFVKLERKGKKQTTSVSGEWMVFKSEDWATLPLCDFPQPTPT